MDGRFIIITHILGFRDGIWGTLSRYPNASLDFFWKPQPCALRKTPAAIPHPQAGYAYSQLLVYKLSADGRQIGFLKFRGGIQALKGCNLPNCSYINSMLLHTLLVLGGNKPTE